MATSSSRPVFRWRLLLALAAIVLLVSSVFWFERFSVTTSARRLPLDVEIAKSVPEIRQGLMYREELCAECGMLFVFNSPQPVGFWMKDTLLPLDMIMMQPDGLVEVVHAGTVPESTTPSYQGDYIQYVLEVNAGYAERMNIRPGHRLDVEAMLETGKPYRGLQTEE